MYNPSKNAATSSPVPALRPLNFAFRQFSRPMCYVAHVTFQKFQAIQDISVRHAAAAVSEHHIFTARFCNAGANGAAFAAVLIAANDLQVNIGRDGDIFRSFACSIFAAIIDYDYLAC
jgi:hypothetical protein